MKPVDLRRELLYPLTDMAIILAVLFFWVMFNVAKLLSLMPGFIGGILAFTMLLILTPAFLRYALYLLEARANGRQAPVPASEVFALTGTLWSLTPFVLISLVVWGGIELSDYGFVWTSFYGVMFLVIIPASLAVLAITHSPIESLNPVAITRMLRACGPSYFLAPAIGLMLAIIFVILSVMGVPNFIIELGVGYQAVLMFTLTGSVLHKQAVVSEVDIDDPLESDEKQIADDLEKEREKVASHAYGFISRGNREGGFAHIMDWIEKEADVHEASSWFFNKMMKWESKDAALFYAQIYLAHLLHHDEDLKTLKLVSVCLHENPRWKPKVEDRQHVLELAEKFQRKDLLSLLRN
jgi:hypothetical protein